jgi:hypothetical protein
MCFWWKAAVRLELHHKLLKIDLLEVSAERSLGKTFDSMEAGPPAPEPPIAQEQKPPNPESASWPGSAAKDYLAMLSYPFTGMVTGFASLNVNLLLAARRVTSLFALDLSASLASLLAWLFGPAIELESSA